MTLKQVVMGAVVLFAGAWYLQRRTSGTGTAITGSTLPWSDPANTPLSMIDIQPRRYK